MNRIVAFGLLGLASLSLVACDRADPSALVQSTEKIAVTTSFCPEGKHLVSGKATLSDGATVDSAHCEYNPNPNDSAASQQGEDRQPNMVVNVDSHDINITNNRHYVVRRHCDYNCGGYY